MEETLAKLREHPLVAGFFQGARVEIRPDRHLLELAIHGIPKSAIRKAGNISHMRWRFARAMHEIYPETRLTRTERGVRVNRIRPFMVYGGPDSVVICPAEFGLKRTVEVLEARGKPEQAEKVRAVLARMTRGRGQAIAGRLPSER